MLKKLFMVALVAVGILMIAVATRPSEFHVERTTVIEAQPGAIYPLISDFEESLRWSPWADLDPNMQKTFSGADEGVGQVYAWSGNDAVGAGEMKMVEVQPNERVRMELHNTRPFESTSMTAIELEPVDEGTRVVWSLSGRFNLMERAFSLFFSMDEMVGPDFERGLSRLKALVES